MKKLLSAFLAITMLISMLPETAALEGSADDNISIKYDIGRVFLENAVSKLSAVTEEITNGFFRSNADNSASSGMTFRYTRGGVENNGIDMTGGAYVTIDVYVPVAGVYALSGICAKYTSGGIVSVYVNGSEEAAGSYDCSGGTTDDTYTTKGTFSIDGISFNEGWNSIKFDADTKGTLRTFTLSMGDGSACLLYTAEKVFLPIGGQTKLNVVSSKTADTVTEGLSLSTEDDGVIEIAEDGTITALAEGEAEVTVAGDNAVPVTVTVKVQGSVNLTVKYDLSGAIAEGGFGYSMDESSGKSAHWRLLAEMTKKETKGFFEFIPQDGEDYSGDKILRVRQYSAEGNSYIQIGNGKSVTFDLYVPIEGKYNLNVRHHDVKGAGMVSLYVNGSPDAAGSYDCSHETNTKYYIAEFYDEATVESIPFNKGWNRVTFAASAGLGTLGNMTLVGGNGDGRMVMGADIQGLESRHAVAQAIMSDKTLADVTDAKITWASSDPEVATIDRDGEIKEKKKGTTTISLRILLRDGTVLETETEYEVPEEPAAEEPFAGKEKSTEYSFIGVNDDWDPLVNTDQGVEGATNSGDIRGIEYENVTAQNWRWYGMKAGFDGRGSAAILFRPDGYLRLAAEKNEWIAFQIKPPAAGRYSVCFEYLQKLFNTENWQIYIVPVPDSGKLSDVTGLLTKNTLLGEVTSRGGDESSLTEAETVFGTYQFEADTEYLVVFKNLSSLGKDAHLYVSALELKGEAVLKSLFVDLDDDDNLLGYKKTAYMIAEPKLSDGTILTQDQYSVRFRSSDSEVVSVDSESGLVTGLNNGEVTVTATVTALGRTLESGVKVSAVDDSGLREAVLEAPESIYVRGVAITSFYALLNSNNKDEIENITYESTGDGEVDISEKGVITGVKEGVVTVTATGTHDGVPVSDSVDIEVVLHSGKTAPTYYTEDVFAAALENAGKYDWAKAIQEKAIDNGDFYVENYKALLEQMTGEGIPRSRQLGYSGSEDYYYCRYCNSNIVSKYGSSGVGGFDLDYYNRPWKIQCPDCKRLFPSNDFEKFRKLGLLENGQWSRQQALEKHRAMLIEKGLITDNGEEAPTEAKTNAWYEYYGYGVEGGYLFNDLYSELWKEGSETRNIDPRTGNEVDGKRWGVDDGYGYFPGRMEGDVEENHCYIPYYFQNYWSRISSAVSYLTNAYVYTGETQYARAGAILLDRVADFYPGFDLEPWNTPERIWANTDGGRKHGKIHGRINDCHTSVNYILGCDAFFPILTDEEFLREVSENNPGKASSAAVWENWENGILLEVWDAIKTGEIKGNFGMEQESLAAAAIVLDKEPETTQMLEWLYAPNTGDTERNITGGDLAAALIDRVDRDGMGSESAPYYNYIWLSRLYDMAETLSKYKGEGDFRAYEHPKFAKMFSNALSLVLTEDHHAQIADSGAVAGLTFFQDEEIWISAFKNLKDTRYAKDLARYIWLRNGKTAEGLNYGILETDPERLEEEIEALIDEDEPARSEMLSGYGFAVLRAGKNYTSANTANATNNQRDFWIYFGRNTPNASHGHSDTLNIGIEAFGLNLAPEMGYPENTGSQPNRHQWVNAPISHNTVVVDDERMQKFQSGNPLHFDSTKNVKLVDIDAANAYKKTSDYRRSLVMIKVNDDISYGIDFFHILGGNKHTYSFHAQSETATGVEGLDGLVHDEVVKDEQGNDIVGSYAGANVPYGKDPGPSYNDLIYPRGYTWMYDVRRDSEPEKQFSIDFAITDWRKAVTNNKDIHLRVTQLNEFTPSEVAITKGHVPQKKDNKELPGGLEYMLVQREGTNLDTLFTTVFEPYQGSRYIESIEALTVDGVDAADTSVKAVKVTHTGGERADYIVYSTDSSKTYTVRDTDGESVALTFRGFVGVVTKNASGSVIYRYVNDGDEISGATEKAGAFTGTVEGFEKEISAENYIDVAFDGEADLSDIVGRYINVNNGGSKTSGSFNGAYLIEDTTDNRTVNGTVRLHIGPTTLINSYKDIANTDLGFNYDIAEGQSFRIPSSFEEDFTPVFDAVQDNITTSAGSAVSITVNAESPITDNPPAITYVGATLPRGASVDSASGTVTWKPDSSQIGENHFAVTAQDADGREETVHFMVTVYGSTTGSLSSNKTETPSTDTPSGGGGGGGGGGAPDTGNSSGDTDVSNDKNTSASDENAETSPEASGETETLRFTDLGNHAWAEDAINALAAEGIIKGTSASTFSPANNITRADFALLLVRAFKLTSDNTENFADVRSDDYFAAELAIARNTGIVQGIGNNLYAPRNTITRQDMMVIVYRALQPSQSPLATALPEGEPSDGEDVKSTAEEALAKEYADFDAVAEYAKPAVTALIGAGLVNGKNNLIAPTDYTTRAEVAVLIKRILDYTKKGI